MALVTSPIRFSRGTIGNLSFYQDHRGRCIARQKNQRAFDYLDHPDRARQKVSSSEFAHASALAAKLRSPYEDYIHTCSDASYFNRLMGLLRHAAFEDRVSDRGSRIGTRGNIALLEGFEFNKDRHLDQALNADYVTWFDPATRSVRVDIDSFVPHKHIHGPRGARFFQLFVVANVITEEKRYSVQEVSNIIPINSRVSQSHSISLKASDKKGEILTISLGIVFYEEYLGVPQLIRGGAMSFLEIHKISEPAVQQSNTHNTVVNTPSNQQPTEDGLQHYREARLMARYKCQMLYGITNESPAGDINHKITRLRQHRFREDMERLRKG